MSPMKRLSRSLYPTFVNRLLAGLLLSIGLLASPPRSAGQDGALTDLMRTAWSAGPEEALDRYRSLPAGRRSPDLLLDLSNQLLRTGKQPEALTILEHLERQTPGRTRLWLLTGRALAQRGHGDEALRSFRRGRARLAEDSTLSAEERKSMRRRLDHRIGILKAATTFLPCIGPYRAPDGSRYLFKYDPYLNTLPSLVDASTGESHVLYPDSSGGMYWRDEGGERAGSLAFHGHGGKCTTMVVSTGPNERRSRNLGVRKRRLEIDTGSTTVASTLFLPPGEGPFPAVVLTHGAGLSTRYNLVNEASAFAAAGFAAMVYDKPGTGQSSDANWLMLSIDDQAEIVSTLVERLVERTDVSRVGAWGFSQGGWVVPRAAERSGKVDFLILASGAAVSPQEQDAQALRARMKAEGESESAIRSALDYTREMWRRVNAGLPLDSFADLRDEADGADWGQFVRKIQFRFQVDWWRTNEIDAAAALQRVHVPVLALFGHDDRNVLPGENAPRMLRLLNAAPTSDVDVAVLPDSDHQFRSGGDYQPLYFRTMTTWSQLRFGTAQPGEL